MPFVIPCHEHLWRHSSAIVIRVLVELTMRKTGHEGTLPHSSRNASMEWCSSPILSSIVSVQIGSQFVAAVDLARSKAMELAPQIHKKDSFELQDQFCIVHLRSWYSYPPYETLHCPRNPVSLACSCSLRFQQPTSRACFVIPFAGKICECSSAINVTSDAVSAPPLCVETMPHLPYTAV